MEGYITSILRKDGEYILTIQIPTPVLPLVLTPSDADLKRFHERWAELNGLRFGLVDVRQE